MTCCYITTGLAVRKPGAPEAADELTQRLFFAERKIVGQFRKVRPPSLFNDLIKTNQS